MFLGREMQRKTVSKRQTERERLKYKQREAAYKKYRDDNLIIDSFDRLFLSMAIDPGSHLLL